MADEAKHIQTLGVLMFRFHRTVTKKIRTPPDGRLFFSSTSLAFSFVSALLVKSDTNIRQKEIRQFNQYVLFVARRVDLCFEYIFKRSFSIAEKWSHKRVTGAHDKEVIFFFL